MSQYFLQVIGPEGHFDLHSGINTVGRNPTNDVRLHEASVSSFHCEIEVIDDHLAVRDLQSTNGTRVNDRPVEESPLQAGDVLTLGQLRLQVECEAPPVRSDGERTIAGEDSTGAVRTGTDGGVRPPLCFRCSRCHKVWAEEHVQRMVWSGDGTELRFCPECSGRCSPLEAGSSDTVQLAEPSLLKRLSRTIQIGRRHRA